MVRPELAVFGLHAAIDNRSNVAQMPPMYARTLCVDVDVHSLHAVLTQKRMHLSLSLSMCVCMYSAQGITPPLSLAGPTEDDKMLNQELLATLR